MAYVLASGLLLSYHEVQTVNTFCPGVTEQPSAVHLRSKLCVRGREAGSLRPACALGRGSRGKNNAGILQDIIPGITLLILGF